MEIASKLQLELLKMSMRIWHRRILHSSVDASPNLSLWIFFQLIKIFCNKNPPVIHSIFPFNLADCQNSAFMRSASSSNSTSIDAVLTSTYWDILLFHYIPRDFSLHCLSDAFIHYKAVTSNPHPWNLFLIILLLYTQCVNVRRESCDTWG